jgi:hypothetical protein
MIGSPGQALSAFSASTRKPSVRVGSAKAWVRVLVHASGSIGRYESTTNVLAEWSGIEALTGEAAHRSGTVFSRWLLRGGLLVVLIKPPKVLSAADFDQPVDIPPTRKFSTCRLARRAAARKLSAVDTLAYSVPFHVHKRVHTATRRLHHPGRAHEQSAPSSRRLSPCCDSA